MSYINLAKELRNNIMIMTSTFENNNLQVLNIGCRPYADDDADLILYVELASITGTTIPSNLYVKVNLYDSDENIYMTCSENINIKSFCGYDTIEINCYDSSHTLITAKSGKLYVVRDI